MNLANVNTLIQFWLVCLCVYHAHLKCLGGQRVPNGLL